MADILAKELDSPAVDEAQEAEVELQYFAGDKSMYEGSETELGNPVTDSKPEAKDEQQKSERKSSLLGTPSKTSPIPEGQDILVDSLGTCDQGAGTFISRHVQGVLEKEIELCADEKVDLQSTHLFEYLDLTVSSVLVEGLKLLAERRPEDPIEFLAMYLLQSKSM